MVTPARLIVMYTTKRVGGKKIPLSCPGYEPTAYDHARTSTVDTDKITVAEEIASNYVKRCNSVSPTTIIIWFWGGAPHMTHYENVCVCVCVSAI